MGNDILPVVWFALIGLAIMMYIILDGFSLGIGILFPFVKEGKYRDIMMNTAAPVWDGNQTWMILGGAGLYGAFPLAYATILPAMYLPLILMLLALIFRGIAFEFRFKSNRSRKWFDFAFSGGAIVATFAQGVVLGGIIGGFQVENRQYAGNTFDWFSIFGLFTGIALLVGYALLGAAWLVVKTEGNLQKRFYRIVRPLTLLLILAMLIISIWTPLSNDRIADRWFNFPNIIGLSIVPILVVVLTLSIIRSIAKRHEKLIFIQVVGLFLLGLIGLVISFFPVLIPPDITIWDASSHRSSQIFLLVGYSILLPIVLAYTAYSYWIFRGKVREGEGYH
ncbi:cytochrome d ubiquinol oxidase subunit II [Phytohalomonas tamaricis]|uniref:cytochrome d ubiquinol oxidase subunit II n=1 Tax=Phytohalomonas tamaricis TaxID=2081032 RepID=UPI000D0BBAC3|nr:cytochrome d ubiquinol oxidase subunit II [Phytohalomonas tamaricis]